MTLTITTKVSNIVTAKFDNNDYGRKYDFKNTVSGLDYGDKVVVDTQHGFAIATVIGFKDESTNGTKYVIQKIDVKAHEDRLKKDVLLKEMKKKMESRRKQLQENEVYRILAKEDSEMAELLSAFDNLKEVTN